MPTRCSIESEGASSPVTGSAGLWILPATLVAKLGPYAVNNVALRKEGSSQKVQKNMSIPKANAHRSEPDHQSASSDCLITKEQVREKLNLVSTRGVDDLVRRRVIPVIILGHRTRRFSWPAVQAAIAKLTVKSI